ncbi:hypothetical protein Z517_08244 [Fonsecaea pedrosoi CBS 271.37]|uniref:Unplaced genomic scaffold supercont1.5, whole genome shotgun sequence n=1 Tax=Fonsecaea pedrosoi CBS 271.37 TaxID=1442368 RepID=A0A0D2GCJ8_9EURO|nr:uncharacterized protein Z517_08244 [Fonsecaea pedrosoi CBS 271.37]KIW78408.1 hypothetical protein Z517_08244 [Fonsecaea pedrosoi CBS 271.37]
MAFHYTLGVSMPLIAGYLCYVRYHRYKRERLLSRPFGPSGRPLSSMTLDEAYAIIDQLQTLEFPTAFDKARAYALLKTGGIPTMTKLFMATGQNNPKNATKRAVDTNILLLETQTNPVTSDRHFQAIARINYLHARYRATGKILDEDMLHTLGDGLAEIVRWVNDYEWRRLNDVEVCALGVWHMALGEAMEIPYTMLPSCEEGWENGLHFAREMMAWTLAYEAKVAINTPNNSAFVNNYFETKAGKLPSVVKPLIKQMLAVDIDPTMRRSMGLPVPNLLIASYMRSFSTLRRFFLRYLSLPRAPSKVHRRLAEKPHPGTKLYNFGTDFWSHGISELPTRPKRTRRNSALKDMTLATLVQWLKKAKA